METWRRSELMQVERGMAMMRYWPAKGTAGLARSRVRGKSLSPAPPASKTPSVSLISIELRHSVGQIDQPIESDAQNRSSAAAKRESTMRDRRSYLHQ